MELVNAVRERLQSYRPRLELALFGLSLLGVLNVVHLYIQQTRQFQDGCLGFASLDAAASTFNCAAVTSGPGSELFGVSNITWGLGFYLFVAVITVLVFWAGPERREWVQGGRTAVLTGGFLYSGYLTYLQLGLLDAVCLLCLGSALIATLLFATQVAMFTFSSSAYESPMPSRLVKRQVALFVYFVATALVLVGADLVYFDTGNDSTQNARAATSNSSSGPAQCRLDTTKAAVGNKGASLVGFQDITKGSGEAGVTVIEYFDPNCPHCKDFHGIMKKVMEAHSDVRYVFKPFALRRSSLPEIQALYVAAQSDKFSEMLDAQYARQGRGGINMSDLRAIASEIGMNPDVLEKRIQQNEYRDQALRLRKRAVKIGVDSTPTVLVNGHFVQNRTFKCMNTFVQRAKSGTLGGSSTSK